MQVIQFLFLFFYFRWSDNMLSMQQRVRSQMWRPVRFVQFGDCKLQLQASSGASQPLRAYSLPKNQSKRWDCFYSSALHTFDKLNFTQQNFKSFKVSVYRSIIRLEYSNNVAATFQLHCENISSLFNLIPHLINLKLLNFLSNSSQYNNSPYLFIYSLFN